MHRAIAVVVLTCSLAGSAGAKVISYKESSIGFGVGFVVVNPSVFRAWPVSSTSPNGVGLDIGGRGDVAFSLGRFGEAHYKPAIGLAMAGGDEEYVSAPSLPNPYVTRDWFYLQVHIDVFDLAYYFPLPQRINVRPYAGFGPTVTIDHWRHKDSYHPDADGTDPDVGFNVYAGADFRVTSSMCIAAEIGGKLGDWDVFKLSGGMRFTIGRGSQPQPELEPYAPEGEAADDEEDPFSY